MARNKNKIPSNIFNCGLINSGGAFIIPTLNIISGILKIIIMILPIVKFLLFKRFIAPEIEEIDVKIGEAIKKVYKIKSNFFNSISNMMEAIGKIIIKGS